MHLANLAVKAFSRSNACIMFGGTAMLVMQCPVPMNALGSLSFATQYGVGKGEWGEALEGEGERGGGIGVGSVWCWDLFSPLSDYNTGDQPVEPTQNAFRQ